MFVSNKQMLATMEAQLKLQKENSKLELENIRLKDDLMVKAREAYLARKECEKKHSSSDTKKEVTQDNIKCLYNMFIAKENDKLKLYTEVLELNKADITKFFENLYYNNKIFEFLDYIRTKGYVICKTKKKGGDRYDDKRGT